MDRHHQQQRLRFLAGTGPFSSETPNSRSTDQSRMSPETSTHNPFPLEFLFSRLDVSNDTQDLYPRFNSKILDGSVVNLNSFDGFALSGVYQAGFSTTQNNDIDTFGATRIQDFLRNPIIAGSNSDLRTNSSVYCGAYQNPDFNDRRGLVQRESIYRSINNGLVSKNQNSLIRRPLRLQDYLSWEDLSGKVVALAKDPYGCKFLQKLIESATREQINMLFYEVIGYVGGLIVDPFGNYVVQKLVEVLSEEQRTGILRMLTRTDFQLVRICLDVHGTRVVQKLLNCITNPQQVSIVVSALSLGAVALITDSNGHHVIQHFVKHFSTEDNKYILKQVAENCFGIATNKSGCCVLQRCVEYSEGEARDRLLAEIIANALLLAEDHYGNYVVQHILKLKLPEITENLLAQFKGSYMALSCNKYGSNVVESCLLTTREEQSTQIILELLGNPLASILLVDPFGNFVIQKALSVSQGQVQRYLVALIQMNAQKMRSNIYGQKVLVWLNKNMRPLQL
ncbi:pumilio homolog 12 [Populus alba]|uniref:pumilio homolog 12 n=1 Tax=Populus alba TaxID=43335 RepID=UPI00158C3A9F|nr:pumilio homolog 12-like [Populus alba]